MAVDSSSCLADELAGRVSLEPDCLSSFFSFFLGCLAGGFATLASAVSLRSLPLGTQAMVDGGVRQVGPGVVQEAF